MFTTAFADTGTVVNAIFGKIVTPVINFLFIVAFLYFLWGIIVFIKNSNNETERAKGKKHIMWGLVGFVVMFGAYTIMQVIINTLDLDSPPGGPDYRNVEKR